MNGRRHVPSAISVEIYKRANNRCEEPNCQIGDSEFSLEIHHLDGNRDNNDLDNLILLCPNHHRSKHFEGSDYYWLRRGVEEASIGEEIKKETIFSNADELSGREIPRTNTENFNRLIANNIIARVKRGRYKRMR